MGMQEGALWGRWMKAKTLAAYLDMSKVNAIKIGMAAAAKLKIGGMILYDRERIDAYMTGLLVGEVEG